MGIEKRKGRLYMYARERVNGRPRKRYQGPLSNPAAPQLLAALQLARAAREESRARVREAAEEADQILAAAAELDREADRVFRAVMHLAGYWLHGRSEWRRRKGVVPMASPDQLFAPAPARGPRPALVRPVSRDPDHQRLLDQAATGDPAVLPAVLDLLKDPFYATSFGAAGHMAGLALVEALAGDNLVIREAVKLKLQEYTDKLLADCGPAPSFAERMAAIRAAHNWLAVHILELKAARSEPAAARVIEARLSTAERRLHAALKSLAVLRRFRRPAVTVGQVNVTTGPMLVDNRGADPAPQTNPDPRPLPAPPAGRHPERGT